jgi:formylglycine-generating enzyme required for sulfatase activity
MTLLVLWFPLIFTAPALAGDVVDVPAGTFQQGREGVPDETPREVTLSAYRIDRTEVSLVDFEAFMAQGAGERSHWTESGWTWHQAHTQGAGAVLRAADRTPEHPVVAVTWYEAAAYCSWAGGSLPTEAQWEHAACGKGDQRYAWGDSEDVDATWYGGGKFGHIQAVQTDPAGDQDAALASPHGLLHTAGNVWEWTADHYHRDGYAPLGEDATDPTGPADGPWRVLRGGSFMNLPSYCTCTHREPATPDRVAFTTGFRCAYPAP